MKTVLISGASTGIGETTALQLAAQGWRVFAGVRKAQDAERLRTAHPNIQPLLLDVTDSAQIQTAVQEITAQVGSAGLDGLVNNAGIAVAGPLEFLPIAEVRRQLEVNFFGQIMLFQACMPLLRQARGRIVNISSVAGRIAYPFMTPYSASKYALEAVSDGLRLELAQFGIKVSLVCPGRIATPIWGKSLQAGTELLDQFSDAEKQLYSAGLKLLIAQGKNSSGLPASAVADKIQHALQSARPRARYIVGADARFGDFLGRLPAGLRDWLIRTALKRIE